MAIGKSQLLEVASNVLVAVTEEISNPNVADTAVAVPSEDAKRPLGFFVQKITVDGVLYIVSIMSTQR